MIRTWVALPAVLVLCACTSNSAPSLPDADYYVGPGQDFGLRIGETAAVALSTAFGLVRFDGVEQDSRCPVGVQCIAAGSATVLLSVQTTLEVQSLELEVPPSGEAEATVAEVTVQIFGLQPAAEEGVTIDPLSYIVGMRVLESGSVIEIP